MYAVTCNLPAAAHQTAVELVTSASRNMRLDNGLLEPRARLTSRQLEVLSFIWTFFQRAETYPTHREIATAIGAQSTNAAPWLNALEKKGVLSRPARGIRNIRLTREGLRVLVKAGVIPQGEQLEL